MPGLRCESCGYSREALGPDDRCPECGRHPVTASSEFGSAWQRGTGREGWWRTLHSLVSEPTTLFRSLGFAPKRDGRLWVLNLALAAMACSSLPVVRSLLGFRPQGGPFHAKPSGDLERAFVAALVGMIGYGFLFVIVFVISRSLAGISLRRTHEEGQAHSLGVSVVAHSSYWWIAAGALYSAGWLWHDLGLVRETDSYGQSTLHPWWLALVPRWGGWLIGIGLFVRHVWIGVREVRFLNER